MLALNVTAETWPDLAACRGRDPEVFFPTIAKGGCYTQAKAICATCEVRTPCLERAMRAEHGKSVTLRDGCFGGMSPRERAALARQRNRA